MTNLILREWEGKTIRQREDGYISLTDMAAATNKKVSHWSQLDSTEEYLIELSKYAGIPAYNLIQTSEKYLGTWAHRKVAIRFTQWCNVQFAIQVDSWIEELLTGRRLELNPPEESDLDSLTQKRLNLIHTFSSNRIKIVNLQEENRILGLEIRKIGNEIRNFKKSKPIAFLYESPQKSIIVDWLKDKTEFALLDLVFECKLETDTPTRMRVEFMLKKMGYTKIYKTINGLKTALFQKSNH